MWYTGGMTMKTRNRGIKSRWYPTPEQEYFLNRQWGCARLVYNKGLEFRKTQWQDHSKSTNYNSTCKELTTWKKDPDLEFLNEVSNVVLQQSLKRLDKAYQGFFGKRAGFPRRKSRKKSTLSLDYTKSGFSIKPDGVYLAKCPGVMDIHFSEEFDLQDVTSLTVSRDAAGRWFVSMKVEDTVETLVPTGREIGLDVGVKDAVVTSDGDRWNPEDAYDVKTKRQRTLRAQKNLSRKTKGSANWEKARQRLARCHARETDARQDWLHKTTTRIIRDNDVVCIEDLNVSGMTRAAKGKGRKAKAGLNRKILEHSFGEFRRQLTHKADWYGREVVVVDRYYPSTKTCSSCGGVNQDLTLADRYWTCGRCGARHDRDHNAATNIKAEGLRILGTAP